MHENPRELLHVLASTARPVREGHKPNGGHERSGAVGLRSSTCEPAEQRGATFGGGWGGKTQTEENIVPSHMHPTQSGKRMSQGLNGVRQVAQRRKQERFTALLHHLR